MDKMLLTAIACVLTGCSYLAWPEALSLIGGAEELIEREIEREGEDAIVTR